MATTINTDYENRVIQAICEFFVIDPITETYYPVHVGQQFRWRYKETPNTSGGCPSCGTTTMTNYIVDADSCGNLLWGGQGAQFNSSNVEETTDIIMPPVQNVLLSTEASGQYINWQDINDPKRKTLYPQQRIKP